ncbi:rCG61624 [Rattus norvegicus]|uniref:RCG61624 n=1 Tax=Rattus norvegicus TaxID=10116 RepID=A6HBN2_RAT|nr:rCG61624 [Rattus norvegicus]
MFLMKLAALPPSLLPCPSSATFSLHCLYSASCGRTPQNSDRICPLPLPLTLRAGGVYTPNKILRCSSSAQAVL